MEDTPNTWMRRGHTKTEVKRTCKVLLWRCWWANAHNRLHQSLQSEKGRGWQSQNWLAWSAISAWSEDVALPLSAAKHMRTYSMWFRSNYGYHPCLSHSFATCPLATTIQGIVLDTIHKQPQKVITITLSLYLLNTFRFEWSEFKHFNVLLPYSTIWTFLQ